MGVHVSTELVKPPEEGSLLDALEGGGRSIGSALGDGMKNVLGGIGDALRGIFDPLGVFAGIGQAADNFRDGQTDLNDRVDLLSPIQDYGSVYMPAGGEIRGARVLPFTEQLGPMRGCSRYGNGIRIDDVGLWDIRAQITVSWISFQSSTVEWRVKVLRPDGSLFSQQKHVVSSSGNSTGVIVSSVVVDKPGFYVEVQIDSIAGNRGILGGPAWTRLVTQHISRQVAGSWKTGAENSDNSTEQPEPDPPSGQTGT